MAFPRSALFAALIATTALGCQQADRTMREQAPPPAMPAPTADEPATEVDSDTTTPEMTTPEMTPPATTSEQTSTVGIGTSTSYGAGAVGGPAIAHGLNERRSQGQAQAREGAPVRRRSTPSTASTPSTTVDPNTLSPTIQPQPDTTDDTVVPPAEQEPGTSDTSTQGTRTNPDSQEQGIGAGDTYDRNR